MVPNHKTLSLSLIMHTHKLVTCVQSLTLAHLAAGQPSLQDSLLFSDCSGYGAFKPAPKMRLQVSELFFCYTL